MADYGLTFLSKNPHEHVPLKFRGYDSKNLLEVIFDGSGRCKNEPRKGHRKWPVEKQLDAQLFHESPLMRTICGDILHVLLTLLPPSSKSRSQVHSSFISGWSSAHCSWISWMNIHILVGRYRPSLEYHLNTNHMLDNPPAAEIPGCHPIFFSAEPHHPCEMPTRGAGYRKHPLGRRSIFLTHRVGLKGWSHLWFLDDKKNLEPHHPNHHLLWQMWVHKYKPSPISGVYLLVN